eukprot:PLAT2816.1.p2 GENE.PLAT2816.1~~PLAT2816.1.p2  ORF type:complete len:250 (-),score=102.11 PLAT2816.1:81-761(-)
MHRLFGRKKEVAPPPSLDDSIGRVDGRIAGLDAKIKDCEKQLRAFSKQKKRARGGALASINKRALAVLKRKKMYEKQRDAMAQQSFNMEQTAFALDTVKDSLETVATMKEATKAMKKQHKEVKLDEIEDLHDELEDLLEDTAEIQDVLGRSFGVPDGVDEEDLEDELAMLEDEWEMDDEADAEGVPDYLASDPAPAFPEAPVGERDAVPADGVAVDEYGMPVAERA